MHSINEFTSDGAKSTYAFNFTGLYPGYIHKDHIQVYYDNVLQATNLWSFSDDAIILLNPVPAAEVVITIKRVTPVSLLVNYSSGAILSEHNLDKGALQLLYLIQEAQDRLELLEA